MNMQNTVPEFGLVIVGDEILSGKRQDKHLSKVIELLSLRGLSIGYADYVGDDPRRLTQTLHRAFHQPGVVFCCGGIGATPMTYEADGRQFVVIASGNLVFLRAPPGDEIVAFALPRKPR